MISFNKELVEGIVTVPLGLWMFERPGELRLIHSWFKFRIIY